MKGPSGFVGEAGPIASESEPPSPRATTAPLASAHEKHPIGQSGVRLGVIARLGRRYVRGHPLLVVFYVVGSLLSQTIIPQQAAIYFAVITNHFQGGEAASAPESEASVAGSKALAPGPDASGLLRSYAFWLLLTLGLVFVAFGHQCLVAFLDGNVTNSVRADVFSAILRQSPPFFHENDPDRLTMIVNQSCNFVATSVRRMLVDPVLEVVSIAIIGQTIYSALAGLIETQAASGRVWTVLGVNGIWFVFGIIVVFALTSPWIVNRLGRYLERDSSAVQDNALDLATLVGGALRAPEEVQAMNAEELFDGKHSAALRRSLELRMAQAVTMEKINAFSGLPGSIVLAAFVGIAIWLETARVGGQPGTVVQVALLTPLLMGTIQSLSSFGITAHMAWPTIELVSRMLERRPDVKVSVEAASPETVEPTLEARDLVFSYRPGERPNVLDGASFSIPAGRVTALVARPGQGKTTFFRLALRFYDPQRGSVLLGRQPVDGLTLHSLRRHVVLMSQFPAFFCDTTRDNLRIAKPTATDEEIESLCRFTGVWDVLENSLGRDPLAQPFAAGAGLSGGQRKLFALTRCLLREPAILLLDEPTTGMGPMEKFPLIEAMRTSLAGKTVVVVDHDIIWQSRFCDHFLVLDGGRIVQEGSRDELLAEEGLFRTLYENASQSHPDEGDTDAARASV